MIVHCIRNHSYTSQYISTYTTLMLQHLSTLAIELALYNGLTKVKNLHGDWEWHTIARGCPKRWYMIGA